MGKINIPKGIFYILLSVATGMAATFAVHHYVAAKTKIPTVATGQVAVAAAPIAPGSLITPGMVQESVFPKHLIPGNAASSFRDLEGRVAGASMERGEMILFNKLAPEGTAAGLGGLLAEDKRALTVRVDDVTGVAGFIHPGDRVDVLADLKVPKTSDAFSKIILQNVPVLTIGQIWEEQKGERKPVLVSTVTLELTPAQAEVLNLASNEGKIRLALRNRRHQKEDTTQGVAIAQLVQPATSAPQPAKNKAGKSVELIKGVDRSEVQL